MNFEEVYKKIQSGTANEEEIKFMSDEMDKIRRISSILDEPVPENTISVAEKDTIVKARKKFNKKTTIRIIVVTLASLILIAAITCGIIFIPPCVYASKSENLTLDECFDLGKEFIGEYTGEDPEKFIVRDIDREIMMRNGAKNAVYIYEIKFKSPEGIKYEIEVSTKSGYVTLTDIDAH